MRSAIHLLLRDEEIVYSVYKYHESDGNIKKSVGTQVSGYLAKELIAELQSEILGPKDSDCGTLGYLEVQIPSSRLNDFVDRYIIEGGRLKILSEDVIKSYAGKTVKMRSPMFCTRVGKKKCLCNKCAGDYYYKLNKENIGLVGSKVATTLTQLNLQKFHENLVKTHQIDVNDILI